MGNLVQVLGIFNVVAISLLTLIKIAVALFTIYFIYLFITTLVDSIKTGRELDKLNNRIKAHK